MSFLDEFGSATKNAMHRGNANVWHNDFLATGIPGVDYALGGGFAYGRFAELLGRWSSGKTMVLYKALAENIKRGGDTILCEAEGAFSPEFFELMGGDPSKLRVYEAITVEGVFQLIFDLATYKQKKKHTNWTAVGWDGIAATGTKHLIETDLDTRDMSKANAMNMGVQKCSDIVSKANIAVIATNQIREKIGSNDSEPHTPGGKAYPFICSQRVELVFDGGSKGSKFVADDQITEIGRWVRGQVIKNKCASPFKRFGLPIFIEAGFDHPDYSYQTSIGIDSYMALFYDYKNSRILMPDKSPVITEPSTGWFLVNPLMVNGNEVKFRKKQWVEIIGQYPYLWQYPYARTLQARTDPTELAPQTGDQPGLEPTVEVGA